MVNLILAVNLMYTANTLLKAILFQFWMKQRHPNGIFAKSPWLNF